VNRKFAFSGKRILLCALLFLLLHTDAVEARRVSDVDPEVISFERIFTKIFTLLSGHYHFATFPLFINVKSHGH